MTARSFRRFTSEVGECNACTNESETVTVVGVWPTANGGRETRFCDDCLTEMIASAISAQRKPARHTSSMTGTADDGEKRTPSARPDLADAVPESYKAAKRKAKADYGGVISRKAAGSHLLSRSNGKQAAAKPTAPKPHKRTKPFAAKPRAEKSKSNSKRKAGK